MTKRFVVGQDTTDLMDAAGKVLATFPRWTESQQRSVYAALCRSTPGLTDKVHVAERQAFKSRRPTVAERVGAALAQASNVMPMRRRA